MPNSKTSRRPLDLDRKVQLKMRIALKRLHGQMPSRRLDFSQEDSPEPEVVGRLIDAVRRL